MSDIGQLVADLISGVDPDALAKVLVSIRKFGQWKDEVTLRLAALSAGFEACIALDKNADAWRRKMDARMEAMEMRLELDEMKLNRGK